MQEWSEQVLEMQRKWVEQQQKLMTDWLDSMKHAGSGAPSTGWREAANVMEQQVSSALEAQKRSLQTVAGNVQKIDGVPEQVAEAVNQMQEGIERWTEVQEQLWKVWFDALRAASPTPKTPGETMMEGWEDMVKRTMSIQEQWLNNWKEAGGGASSTKPAKTAKKDT